MDPLANLAEQHALANEILSDTEHDSTEMGDMAVRLAELVQALEEWRGKGGFEHVSTRSSTYECPECGAEVDTRSARPL